MGAKPVVFNLPLRRTGSGVRAVRLHNRDTHSYGLVVQWLEYGAVTAAMRVRFSSRPPFMRGWLSGLKLRTANALWVNSPPRVRISPLAPLLEKFKKK